MILKTGLSQIMTNKTFSYRRRTARRYMTVEILSTDAELYEKKSHLETLAVYVGLQTYS